MLCIPPLMDEVEAMKVAEDKCISKIVEIAGQLGATTTEIDDFFHKLKILCNSTDLVIEDILHNLSNIGYHPNFGLMFRLWFENRFGELIFICDY